METLEKQVRELNKEILRLKTSQPLKSNMITFFGKYNYAQDTDKKNHKYEITYVDGAQPIITTSGYSPLWSELVFGEPSGNKQIMFDMQANHPSGDYFTLLSTRQILSVRKIS